MRRTFLILSGILIGLFIVLSLLDTKGEYIIEQLLWRANKRLVECVRSPEVVPDKVFAQIAGQYQKIIQEHPKSALVPSAHLFLARVYIVKKDYNAGRKKLNEVLEKFPENTNICVEALVTIGSSYEAEGNWTQALETYGKLKQEYPLTDFGLNIPYYIASYYERNGHFENAQIALNEAIGYYQKLSSEHPGSAAGLKSMRLLANCYIAKKNWTEVLSILEKILTQYPNPEVAMPVVEAINKISTFQLKDYDVAISIYKRVLNSSPHYPLSGLIKKVISTLSELKNKEMAGSTGKK